MSSLRIGHQPRGVGDAKPGEASRVQPVSADDGNFALRLGAAGLAATADVAAQLGLATDDTANGSGKSGKQGDGHAKADDAATALVVEGSLGAAPVELPGVVTQAAATAGSQTAAVIDATSGRGGGAVLGDAGLSHAPAGTAAGAPGNAGAAANIAQPPAGTPAIVGKLPPAGSFTANSPLSVSPPFGPLREAAAAVAAVPDLVTSAVLPPPDTAGTLPGTTATTRSARPAVVTNLASATAVPSLDPSSPSTSVSPTPADQSAGGGVAPAGPGLPAALAIGVAASLPDRPGLGGFTEPDTSARGRFAATAGAAGTDAQVAATFGGPAEAALSAAPATTPASGADPAVATAVPDRFTDQVAGQLVRMVSVGPREMVMRLHPPELGELTLRVAISGRDVTAWFASPQPQVQSAISNALDQLQTNLGAAGYNLNGAWVGADAAGARQQRQDAPAVPVPARPGASGLPPISGGTGSQPRVSGMSIYV
jgi:flagellar hook-length control protein FliK